MKLEFKINKFFLIRSVFASNAYYIKERKPSPFPFWKILEEKIGKKFLDEPAYYFINPIHLEWAFNEINIQAGKKGFKKTFLEIALMLEKIYKEIIKTKEFKKIFSETEKYKKFVENQWNKNEKFVLNYIKNTLGLKIPNYTITVYITHPKLFHGRANHYARSIMWGHSEDWKNYSTVYLVHELLHILIPQNIQKKYDPMTHAFIEIAADNDLRRRLNPKKGLPKEDKYKIGHPYLKKMRKSLFDEWKTYLDRRIKSKKGNLIDLIKILAIKKRRP